MNMGDGADEYLEGDYASALDDEGITCKRCGESGFHWERHKVGKGPKPWRLFDEDGNLHECKPKEPT